MKVILTVFLIFYLALITAAAPKSLKFGFKNLFVKPANSIKTSKPQPRIIGGHEAEPHSIPYQAFITVHALNGGWYCGGSLIGLNTVLTAGHRGYGASEAEIIMGAHRPLQIEDTQFIITSTQIFVHPGYDIEVIANDIAVMKLSNIVPLNKYIQMVPFATDPSISYEGEIATISGWGATNGTTNDRLSEVLNTADATISSNEECNSAFGIIQGGNICISSNENVGTCRSDAGGPLTINGIQVGIASFEAMNCDAGYPSVFVRITSYLDFITNHL